MEVTVIIPNYNHAAYLRQRIDSVLHQTYQDFELIILDDCSTDNSKEIIGSYANHPKVSQIILNKTNSGSTFLQWEKGISLAKGNFIWIAESDDWCEPTLLEVLMEGINQDVNCVISYCQLYCVNDKDDVKWQSQHNKLSELVDTKKFFNDFLAVKVSIYNASMAIFRKDAYYQISKDYTTFKFSGDHLFWSEIARQGSIHISGKLLNYFRKHDNDVSTGAYRSGLNFVEELRVINWMYKEHLITDTTYAAAFRKQFKAYWLVRNRIEPINKQIIKTLFAQPLTPKASMLNFLPSAIWNTFKKH
jgi:glycosyltransferase involved in cell wall biosynthesis